MPYKKEIIPKTPDSESAAHRFQDPVLGTIVFVIIWYEYEVNYHYDIFPSHFLSSPFFSLPPSRNSDPGSHNRLFPPPPHHGSRLTFLSREYVSSSLLDSRRIVLYPQCDPSFNKRITSPSVAGFELTTWHLNKIPCISLVLTVVVLPDHSLQILA